jgi:GrpB-like predicted nucleotidyltransferase (UPF0157 family)
MNIRLKRGTVKLVEHDPQWENEFVREVKRLKEILPGDIGPFEHVGSTSIRGIPAKPIIDLIIGVENLGVALQCAPLLQDAGYTHRPNGDTPSRVLFVRGHESCRTHHFSFITLGSDQWNNCLGFRDILRENPKLAPCYSELKQDLAQKYPEDRASYTSAKEPFFQEVFEIVAKKGNN